MRGFVLLVIGATACAGQPPAPEAPVVENGVVDGAAVAYRIVDGERTLGRVYGRLRVGDGRFQLVTRVVLGAARPDGTIIPVRTTEYATSLRKDLAPVSYKRLSSRDGRLTVAFRGDRIQRTTDLDAQEVPRSGSPKALPFVIDDVPMLAFVLRTSGLAPGQSGPVDLLDPATGGADSTVLQVFADGQRRTVTQAPFGKVTFAPDGWPERFEARDGRAFVREADPGPQPELLPTPKPLKYRRPSLAGWRDLDVSVDVEGGRLAGTLSVPRATSQWKSGLAPGVVFLSDLPPQNRHGFGPAIDYGTWRLLDALAEAGFAVLRLDDRGVGASKITAATVPDDLQTAVDDGLRAVEMVGRQPGVDPDAVLIIGHGFGARVAVELATKVEAKGLVLLAPAYRAPEAVLAEPAVQLERAPRVEAERQMRLVLQALKGSAAAESQAFTPDVARLRPSAARLSGYADQDLSARLAEVKTPIAVFQGMRDFETSWRDDAKALVDGVNRRQRRQAKLFVYELVDHHLKAEAQKSSPERYQDRGRGLEPKLVEDLVEWMGGRVKRR